MKKQLCIFTLCIALAACATVNNTYAPDGKKAYALNCSGAARGWDKCQQAAGNICGDAGYKVLEKSTENNSSLGANQYAIFAQQNHERSMLIECK